MGRQRATDKPSTENKAANHAATGTHTPVTEAKSRGKNDRKAENQEKEPKHPNPEGAGDDCVDKPANVTGDAGGAVTDAQNNQSSKPIPYGRHRRTVELATRLACAQITAEAYNRSTRLTVSGIQRVAAAFVMASARIKMELETLRSSPELIDSAFVDRAYADLMRAAEVTELPMREASSLNHPDHDDLFEGAMFRAQRLLRPTSEDKTTIHAEQLFDAEEILSETQVGVRFKNCKWPGLDDREIFYWFIVRVERWFHDHLGRLNFPEEDKQFAEDAEMMTYVLELGRRRQENDLFRRIYDLVKTHEPPNRPREAWTSIEEMSHSIWTRCLIDVIFDGREPSESRKKESRTIRYYRPWGLFRFLRIHGADDPVGSELLESLVRKRKDLTQDADVRPFRQNPGTTDFGPLDRLVSGREREELRKSPIQRAVTLGAATGLLDAVHMVEKLPNAIAEGFQREVLRSARSGHHFDPKWTDSIKNGFEAILLAGTECHMDRMIGFLLVFYLPLLDAYGALDAVAEHPYADACPHELIDLFPVGWRVSLSRKISDSPSPPDGSAGEAENECSSQAAESLILTLRSGAGEERSVSFHRSASLNQALQDEVSDDQRVDETAPQ